MKVAFLPKINRSVKLIVEWRPLQYNVSAPSREHNCELYLAINDKEMLTAIPNHFYWRLYKIGHCWSFLPLEIFVHFLS